MNDIDLETIGVKERILNAAIEEFRKDHREMLEMVFEGIDK